MSRINLRMPERLKARIEAAAAAREGLSVNAWLVRAAAAAADAGSPARSRGARPAGCASATRGGRASPPFAHAMTTRRNGHAYIRYTRTHFRQPSSSGSATSGLPRATAATRSSKCGRAIRRRNGDVSAAEQARVEYADGRLVVKAPRRAGGNTRRRGDVGVDRRRDSLAGRLASGRRGRSCPAALHRPRRGAPLQDGSRRDPPRADRTRTDPYRGG